MKPTIGRIVHYYNGPKPRAAIVINVHNDTWVDLSVFDRSGGVSLCTDVEEGPNSGRYWVWPPKEEAPKPTADIFATGFPWGVGAP